MCLYKIQLVKKHACIYEKWDSCIFYTNGEGKRKTKDIMGSDNLLKKRAMQHVNLTQYNLISFSHF